METVDLHKRLNREMLEAIVEVQGKINKLELGEMFEFLVNQIIKTLKIERCSIFRVFPESENIILVSGEPKDGHGLGMEFSFKDLEAIREVVEIKSYLLIENPWQDERTAQSRELIYYKGINALLFIPLVVRNEVAGVIVLDATGMKKTFSQESLYFCLSLSNIIGLLLERDLANKEKDERKTLAVLGQAAAEAAHRMRNPLVPIGGFAKRLAKQAQEPKCRESATKCKEYAEIIVREAGRLESILEDLLRFSRQKKANVVLSDINEIIKEAERIVVEDLVKEKRIITELKLDSEIPLLLLDPMEIRDIFLDILRNAVEAMEAAEKEGIISIRSEKKKNKVKIFISNTGGCIDEEVIDHILDPFFTTKPGGSGLGLASVVRTLDAYGGELTMFNDAQAKRATFVIKLPLTS
ncbi:MAG: ATP-binding protein [Candidatus Azambacteria bacterium]|nr:ATP-binding protein [Candidatus Azambacteria bacterium]